jgi:hypothetical protein
VLLSKGVDTGVKDITGFNALAWSKEGDAVYEILKGVTAEKTEDEAPVKHHKTPEKGGKDAKNSGSRNYTITKEVAIDIAKGIPKTSEKVRFIALDYNWGPPMGHRCDVDFLQLWVIATNKSKPKEVSLIGVYQNMKNWDVKLKLDFVSRVDADYDLYFLNLETSRLPVEFVIKLECQDGSVHYDNNGGYGVNYKLLPYQGRYTSAHAGDDHIQIYPNFVRCQIISRKKK